MCLLKRRRSMVDHPRVVIKIYCIRVPCIVIFSKSGRTVLHFFKCFNLCCSVGFYMGDEYSSFWPD